MSKGPQKVRGTQDMIGVEAERFHQVVDAFDRVRRLHPFQHIEVPVFQATEVFARTAALNYNNLVSGTPE